MWKSLIQRLKVRIKLLRKINSYNLDSQVVGLKVCKLK